MRTLIALLLLTATATAQTPSLDLTIAIAKAKLQAKPVTLPAPVVVPTQPAAAAKPQPARTAGADKPKAAPLYPSRSASGSNWTYNGSANIPASHLIQSHGLDPATAYAMTPAQRAAYHADAHEGWVRRNHSATPKSSSGCPSGNCPNQSTTPYRRIGGLRLFR